MKPRCPVCHDVPDEDLIELDLLMGDPTRWARTVWDIFDPPKGQLTPAFRRYGAVEMGLEWAHNRGFEFNRGQMRRHYRQDVPMVSVDPVELVARGIIDADETGRADLPDVAALDPVAFLTFYARGIQSGLLALDILNKRLLKMAQDGTSTSSTKDLFHLADLAAKLSMSQAAIKSAGRHFGDEPDDDAFRSAGSDDSPRFGDTRIRRVNGERRPIRDRGPADRAEYNERAEQDGTEPLPSRLA